MNIGEIPSDAVVIMTELWHRAFNAAGCDPMCHCCNKMIEIDKPFKLATVKTYTPLGNSVNSGIDVMRSTESREVMLCDTCTVKKMNNKTKSRVKNYKDYKNEDGGCFRINGKIIH